MDDFSAFVPKVHFEQIPIKNLVSNQEYQRNLSLSHVRRTVENFDLYQINPVKVSRRDGVNYVFNGQHTIEIIATVSGSRETPVWCMIYDDLEYTQEGVCCRGCISNTSNTAHDSRYIYGKMAWITAEKFYFSIDLYVTS